MPVRVLLVECAPLSNTFDDHLTLPQPKGVITTLRGRFLCFPNACLVAELEC